MTCRYLGVVETRRGFSVGDRNDLDAAASAAGLSPCLASNYLSLYAPPDTPVLKLPGIGVIIGQLFPNQGFTEQEMGSLTDPSDPGGLCRQLIEHHWGEYLLILPGKGANRDLHVMRDPSGAVPCLHLIDDGRGLFFSDLALAKPFLDRPLQIDRAFLPHLLAYPHMKTERTGLHGLRELLPGTSLRIHPDAVEVTPRWTPWNFVRREQRYDDLATATRAVRHAVESTVQAWSRRDASILLELSGGLDSSIIALCLRGTTSRIEPCTLLTPVPGADERRYAGAVADALKRPLRIAALTFENACFDCHAQADAATPRMTALQFAIDQVMSAAADRYNVTSYYSGGGGDTVFGALATASPAADAFHQRGLSAAMTAVRDLSERHQCTLWKAARLTLKKLRARPKPPRAPERRFSSAHAGSVACEDHPWYAIPAEASPGDRERIFDLVNTQSFRDSAPRGQARPLRLPLLSQPVLETCLRVPSWMWITSGHDRAIARLAFTDVLPATVLNRHSKGTFMSYSGAAYRRNRSRIRHHLLEGRLAATGLLDTDALGHFLDSDLPSDDDSLLRIFDLCMIENWLRQHAAF